MATFPSQVVFPLLVDCSNGVECWGHRDCIVHHCHLLFHVMVDMDSISVSFICSSTQLALLSIS